MPRDDWAKYARRDRARKAVREGTAFHSSFGGILKKPKLGKRRKHFKSRKSYASTNLRLARQPATVNQRALNHATSGSPPAGSPAAGTDRHDALCQIPDRPNGVSSRGVPDRPLPPVCQQPSRIPTAAAGSGQNALADATMPVSGTDRDEGARETSRCKQPVSSA